MIMLDRPRRNRHGRQTTRGSLMQSLMQATSTDARQVEKKMRCGMPWQLQYQLNSAPHRHSHPSLTRTRRPKKLPAPSPSGNAKFLASFLSSRAAAPSLFVISRSCCGLAMSSPLLHARCMSLSLAYDATLLRIPRVFFSPSTQGAHGRSLESRDRCRCNLKAALTHFHMRSGRAKAAWWSLRR